MPTLQVKSLDADLMEAQGHKAAMTVADEMRGLLEGSKRVGTMKAAESDSLPPALSAAAQVCGSGTTVGTGSAEAEGIAMGGKQDLTDVRV
jgi:histidine ammonia-lyase